MQPNPVSISDPRLQNSAAESDILRLMIDFGMIMDERENRVRCGECDAHGAITPQYHRSAPNGALTVHGLCPRKHAVARTMTRPGLDRIIADLNHVSDQSRTERAGRIDSAESEKIRQRVKPAAQKAWNSPERNSSSKTGDLIQTAVRPDGRTELNGKIIANPMALKRGIENMRDAVEEMSTPVEDRMQIAHVASLSARNDEMGELIADATRRFSKLAKTA